MASGQDLLSSAECEARWFGVSHCGVASAAALSHHKYAQT